MKGTKVKSGKAKNEGVTKRDDRTKGNINNRPWFLEKSKIWTGISIRGGLYA